MVGKILSWLLLGILIAVAIFLVYYVVSSRLYASKGQKFKPYFSLYTIISPSMTPNIKVYDTVFDVRVDDINTIKKGDIITFVSASSLGEGLTVTHRVNEVVKTSDGQVKLRTKGDANDTEDSALVDQEHLIGRVLFKIPQLGRIQMFLQKKGAMLFCLLIPALIIVIYDIFKVMRLSNVKKEIDVATEEVPDSKKIKQDKLKKELEDKFINVSKTDDIMTTRVDEVKANDNHQDIVENEVSDVKEINVVEEDIKESNEVEEEPIQEVVNIEDDDIDMKNILANIKKLNKEQGVDDIFDDLPKPKK